MLEFQLEIWIDNSFLDMYDRVIGQVSNLGWVDLYLDIPFILFTTPCLSVHPLWLTLWPEENQAGRGTANISVNPTPEI